MLKAIVVAILLQVLMTFPAKAEKSFAGEYYNSSVTCGSVKASIEANTANVRKPIMFVNGRKYQLDDGPSYHGPVCIRYHDKDTVGFIKYNHNKEEYVVVDPDTKYTFRVSWDKAKRIGFR